MFDVKSAKNYAELNIGGKTRGMYVSMTTLETAGEQLGYNTLDAVLANFAKFKVQYAVIYAAMVKYCNMTNKPIDFEQGEVEVAIDETVSKEDYTAFVNKLTQIVFMSKPLMDMEPEAKKKQKVRPSTK